MKKTLNTLIAGLIATTMVATPALAAAPDRHNGPDNRPTTHQTQPSNQQSNANRNHTPQRQQAQAPQRHTQQQQQQQRQWHRGERFDRNQARNYGVIANPGTHRLNPAPRGYHWVRSGNDAVLVGITTGIIASVIANAMR